MFELIPKWQDLRRLGTNRFLKSAYFWLLFVPVAANLLANVNGLLSFKIFDAEILIRTGLPFSWQVLFFSALFTSFANVIFSLFCPPVIKEFDTYDDFLKTGRGFPQITDYLVKILKKSSEDWIRGKWSQLNRLGESYFIGVPKGWDWPVDAEREFSQRDLIVNFSLSTDVKKRETLNEIFWGIREILDDLNPISRFMCSFFYSIGIMLALVVVLQNIVSVIKMSVLYISV